MVVAAAAAATAARHTRLAPVAMVMFVLLGGGLRRERAVGTGPLGMAVARGRRQVKEGHPTLGAGGGKSHVVSHGGRTARWGP